MTSESLSEDAQMSSPQITDDLIESLPLQGVTEEGFLIIAIDPLVDWAEDVATHFYNQGAVYQIRHFDPRLRAKDDIIAEKDQVIESQREDRLRIQEDLRSTRVALSLSEARSDRRLAERDTARTERDEAIEDASTWRRRFWYSIGISAGVVTVAGVTAWLLSD